MPALHQSPASAPPSEPPGSAPTPAYVYDLAEVRRRHASLRSALPPSSVLYYSLKANPHPLLLDALREGGARPEVCSTGELSAALEAGWSGAEVLYTGPGRPDDEITRALEAGVRLFSVDSPHALDQLDRIASAGDVAVDCLLRVNDDHPVPGQGLVMTGVPSQFGADASWIFDEPERFVSRDHARVVGLHLYMGSNVDGVDALTTQFERSLRTAGRLAGALARHGVRLRLLDLGGGFGAPFATTGGASDLSGLDRRLDRLLGELLPAVVAPGDPLPEVAFESGRYLVATAGTLFTRVLDVKISQGRNVVVLESGINHLGGMSGLRRLPPLRPTLVTDEDRGASETVPTIVTGPLCTPLDTWARAAELPPLRPGDLLSVPNVGAYGLTASLVAFLGRPMPCEVVIDSSAPGTAPAVSRLGLVRTAQGDR